MFGSMRLRGFLASINLGFSFVTTMVGSVVICNVALVAIAVAATSNGTLGLVRKRSSSLRFSSNFSSCKFPVLLSVLYGNTSMSALILSARLVSPAFKLFSISSHNITDNINKSNSPLRVSYAIKDSTHVGNVLKTNEALMLWP
uniref:Uncharacterized protein n=1 Tax=Glossina brevipalpis TaxID=37001 RepID=A0A1A9WCP1_9MUSC